MFLNDPLQTSGSGAAEVCAWRRTSGWFSMRAASVNGLSLDRQVAASALVMDPHLAYAARRAWFEERTDSSGGTVVTRSQTWVEYQRGQLPYPTRYRYREQVISLDGGRGQVIQELRLDGTVRRIGPCKHGDEVFYLPHYGIDESVIDRRSASAKSTLVLTGVTALLVLLALLSVARLRRVTLNSEGGND